MGSLNQSTTWPLPQTGDEEEEECKEHGVALVFWCITCRRGMCRGCEQDHSLDSPTHPITTLQELKSNRLNKIQSASLVTSQLMSEAFGLDNKKQNIIMKLLESINLIKADLEAELVNNNHGGVGGVDFMEIQSLIKQSRSITTPSTSTLSTLESKLNSNRTLLESYIYRTTLNPFSLIDTNVEAHLEAYRLVFNYLSNKFKENQVANISQQPLTNYPKYFIDMEIGGVVVGRVVIATRPDIAPKMCENFKWLMTAQGQSYKGCSVFQCWKRESVITGDFEYNNGRGGYSIFNKNLFLPEDTKLISSRGAIGMRRTQKRHDSKGLVGSQFRIILQDMPGFTGIFGHVVSGLSIIDKISEYGDSSGNPTVKISIFDCGVY